MVNFTYLIIAMSIFRILQPTSGSLFCHERKNITIIPHIDSDWSEHVIEGFIEKPSTQLRYFIKSLFDMGCFDVWIYSPIQNLCIHQTEENYVPFLDTEWIATTSTDDKEIVNLLSDIPHSNDQVEQTLLFVSVQYVINSYKRSVKRASNFVTKLKAIKQKNNIIIICLASSSLCHEGKKWLDNQNVIHADLYNTLFNPHLHRILIDLVNNPQHDWRERYTGGIKNKCKILNSTNAFIWQVYKRFQLESFPEVRYAIDFLNDFFVNITIHTSTTRSNALNGNSYYTLPYENTGRLYSLLELHKDATGITNHVKDIGGDNQVHIIFFFKEIEPDFNQPPFTFNNTIRIIIDRNITESPMTTKDGDFVIWEEDTKSPLLISMLIEKMYSILCN